MSNSATVSGKRPSNAKKDSEQIPLLSTSLSPMSEKDGALYGSSARKATKITVVDKEKPPSIVACLWRLFKWEIIGAMLAKLASDLLQFASPLLLG